MSGIRDGGGRRLILGEGMIISVDSMQTEAPHVSYLDDVGPMQTETQDVSYSNRPYADGSF